MGDDTKIPETHKAPLLLASMGNRSQLESTVAALRTRDTDQLSWAAVSADLIQEYNQLQENTPGHHTRVPNYESGNNNNENNHINNNNNNRNRRFRANKVRTKCEFCGGRNHTAEHCFHNPDSPKCK